MGSQPSLTPKAYISSIPSKNTGMVRPTYVRGVTVLSNHLPRLTAASIPARTPKTALTIKASKPR
ncbi:hypothetical protein ES708_34663 [subsurface metagenome]